MRMTRRQVLAAAAAAPFAATRARAANYPDKPIRVIIPYTAGGDTSHRRRITSATRSPCA